MEEIEDVRARGLRYCAREDTFVGQDPDAPLENGDRNVAVEFFMPADRCSHLGLPPPPTHPPTLLGPSSHPHFLSHYLHPIF